MTLRPLTLATLLTAAPLAGTSLACESAPPEPEPLPTPPATTASASAATSAAAAAPKAAQEDPFKGKEFKLEDATKGLEGDGPLTAHIKTDLGTLDCELFADKAPITVANFVGLARGTRPWKKRGKWVEVPAYDGTTFHRIVKGFMIQGGDPLGTGAGNPGYKIKDEIWEGTAHDRRGLLCMANSGPNTGGIQFFVLDGSAPHLTKAGTYTVFGYCQPEDVVEKLASVETKVVPGKREQSTPVKAPKIESITITRGDGDGAAKDKKAAGDKKKPAAAPKKKPEAAPKKAAE